MNGDATASTSRATTSELQHSHPVLRATSVEGSIKDSKLLGSQTRPASAGARSAAASLTRARPGQTRILAPPAFVQQEDFISFDDVLGSEGDHGSSAGGFPGGPRGRKRNIEEALNDKGKRRLQDVEKTTPWTAEVDWDGCASATEQLTAEIRAFARYIQPTDQEHELRTCVVESIRRLITRRWPDAKVFPFGSFETRLYLPTGDIDLVVISPSIPTIKASQKRILYIISGLLESSGIGRDIVVIAKAKVPIVKFVTAEGGFKVDISLNMTNGINVGKRVKDLFQQVGEEPARALVLVTKAFLNQRNMNEVYSGGLGSYSIICLVISFLQLHPKLQTREMDADTNLGTLLIEFLEVYGKNFNFDEVGICLSGGGSYYSKSRRGWQRPAQPYLLSIEDPADPTNDVAGGSHNIIAVRQSLAGGFEVLTASLYYRTSIMLARIASAQSGRQLSTLSGQVIPHATGEEGADIDECRKSLLGAVLGVTREIELSRQRVKALAQTGRVQRSVGIPVRQYNELGMSIDDAQTDANKIRQKVKDSRSSSGRRAPAWLGQAAILMDEKLDYNSRTSDADTGMSTSTTASKNVKHESAPRHAATSSLPPLPSYLPPPPPPHLPPKPSTASLQPSVISQDSPKLDTTDARSVPTSTNGSAAGDQSVKSQPTTNGRTYINLDSPSPEAGNPASIDKANISLQSGNDQSYGGKELSESFLDAQDDTDSRYAVKKTQTRAVAPKDDRVLYVEPDSSDMSLSDDERATDDGQRAKLGSLSGTLAQLKGKFHTQATQSKKSEPIKAESGRKHTKPLQNGGRDAKTSSDDGSLVISPDDNDSDDSDIVPLPASSSKKGRTAPKTKQQPAPMAESRPRRASTSQPVSASKATRARAGSSANASAAKASSVASAGKANEKAGNRPTPHKRRSSSSSKAAQRSGDGSTSSSNEGGRKTGKQAAKPTSSASTSTTASQKRQQKQQRRDFWSAKGPAAKHNQADSEDEDDRYRTLSASDDSDVVWVRSK